MTELAHDRVETFAKVAKWGSLAVMTAGALALLTLRAGGSLPALPKLSLPGSSSSYAWKAEPPESAVRGDAVPVSFLAPAGSEFENVDITGPDGYNLHQGLLPGTEPRLFVWEWNTFGLVPGDYRIRVGHNLSRKVTLLAKN